MGPEILYGANSALIALLLLAGMLATIWIGRLAGQRARLEDAKIQDQANAVQASLLGLLALLLGFTFSLSLSRHDQRSAAVVAEANAIGTAWLRTDLLSADRREAARELMRAYGAARVTAAKIPDINQAERTALLAEAEDLFKRLWRTGVEEARESGGPAAVAFVSSLNDMTDALGTRNAAITQHVPELVLWLMFATFLILGGVVGYASGTSGSPPRAPIYAMMTLIVVLVFIIIDLDRPRRGLIKVDQSPLVQTVAAMAD